MRHFFRAHEGPFSPVETDVVHAIASFGATGVGHPAASALVERGVGQA